MSDTPFATFGAEAHQSLNEFYLATQDPVLTQQEFQLRGYNPQVIQQTLHLLVNFQGKPKPVDPLRTAELDFSQIEYPKPLLENKFFDLPSRPDGVRPRVVIELKNPHLVVVEDFLSEAECLYLIEKSKCGLQPSRVVSSVPGQVDEVTPSRSSQTSHFPIGADAVVQSIEQRIEAFVKWPVIKAEGLQCIRYEVGEQYMPHYDFFDPELSPGESSNPSQQRLASFIFYLQAPLRGGATSFPRLGLSVAPKRGSGVFFSYPNPQKDDLTYHAGDPVLEGVKWIATKWFKTLHYNG